MKPHPLTHPAKLAAGLLAVLLAAAHSPAASVAITTARNAMRAADYNSMVSTLDTYLAASPGAADAQEARLLRAIGRAGVIAKSSLPAFLIQKGATAAAFDPFDGVTVEFPTRPAATIGTPWEKNGDSYTRPFLTNDDDNYWLAWQNTGSSTRSFRINVTTADPVGHSFYFGMSIYLNGDYAGYLSRDSIYGESPDFPISDVSRLPDSQDISGFTVTLKAGQWLTLESYPDRYSSYPPDGASVTFSPDSTLHDDIKVATGTVPYGAAPAFANGTNLSDIITFLGGQQTAFDNIIADLAAIQSGFSTEFVSAETGIAGTIVVQYADVQMLVGLLKSSQALHRFLNTYNLNVDLTNSNIHENYLSTLTGEWRADDFIINHPDLLRPTAASAGNADCKAMRTLLTDAIDRLLAVENTLFTRAAPAAGKSYLFGTAAQAGGDDSGGVSVGQSRGDYHDNLVKLKTALTDPVDLEGSDLPAGARGSLVPFFGNSPLDLRNLFEFSPRGILAGGSQNFFNSGLLTGVNEYQWENLLRNGNRWALGGDYFYSYYSAYPSADVMINIEKGTAAPIPYYPAGVFGSNAAALSYQWKLRHQTDDWRDPPSFTSIAGATTQPLDLALLTDPVDRGAYLSVGYPGGGELIGTDANVWVNWQDTADFNPDFKIIQSPLSQFFKPGQTINLWVGTSSISKDMQYQWYKNDQPIAGATSALYTIPNATAAAAGNYHVAISNRAVPQAQARRSDTARLVTPVSVASVSVSPASATVVRSATQQFTATVTGSGGSTPAQGVTWSVTAASGAAATAGTGMDTAGLLTVAADETAAALTVRATSIADTGKSGAASVTVAAPVLTVDKPLLALAQPLGSAGTFTVSGNIAWAAQIPPAAGWLAAEPPAGAAGAATTVTLSAIAANTPGTARDTSVTVSGGGLARTVHVMQ
ncbi:MAG: hypothetical protein LBC18_12410, partial [Opitutaceae bacterium]|nr:hypothetical protein [Opitutaceae bacterium]